MKRVCIYARVSTDQQELEHQIKVCRDYADQKGLVVAFTYSDIGSGKDFEHRPNFLQMREQLLKQTYEGVVVFRLDRLGRNVREILNFMHELNERGREVHSINENFDTSTALGRAMLSIMLVLGQLEREMLSEASKQRVLAKKSIGALYHRPKGSKDTKERRKIGYLLRWERERKLKKGINKGESK